jgi:cytoskeletal protein RodZ
MATDIGAELRSAREARGLSVATLAQRTRVQPRMIAAIELNDLSNLPPRPFLRGFVKAYAEEVHLDPERTASGFLAQFPDPPAQAPPAMKSVVADKWTGPAAQWTGLGMAALVLFLLVATAGILGRRGEGPRDADAVGTTGNGPTSAPSASTANAGPSRAAPAAPPAAAPLLLTLSFTRPCWITATVDGKRTLYRTLQPAEPQTIEAREAIVLRIGDAAAVNWTINGRKGESLGEGGAVRDLHITPANAATIR